MDVLNISQAFLATLFFLIAYVYSSVGLGGGSSYTALMAVFGMNTLEIPLISLTLNLFATSVGSYNFIRNRHAKFKLILPFLITSIPMAYVGGALNLPKEMFYGILIASLAVVAARIYVWRNTTIKFDFGQAGKLAISLLAGSILGFIAGIVGIGGGIYLVPIIIILGLGTEKEAAACGAMFVWLNSLSGLIARLQYNSIDLNNHIHLIGAVLIESVLGSFMGSFKYSPSTMQKILGIAIVVAICFLTKKLLMI